MDIPLALFHDSIHCCQPQARPFPLILRGEERLKIRGEDLFVHAVPLSATRRVVYRPGGMVSSRSTRGSVQRDVRSGNNQLPSRRHGVPRIDAEIHQDLLDLARIRADRPQVFLRFRGEVDVFSDQPPKHLPQVLHHFVDAKQFRLQDLPPAVGEELLREGRRTFARLVDLLDLPPHGIPAVDAGQEEFAVSRDHRQEVVEVVGDAPGQFPHGLHLHGLAESSSLRCNASSAVLASVMSVMIAIMEAISPCALSRGAPEKARKISEPARDPAANLRIGESLPTEDEVAGRSQIRVPFGGKKGVRVADRFRFRPSKHPDGSRIPYVDRAGGVADHHRQGGCLDQGVKCTAGFPGRLFRTCPLREVVLYGIQHDIVRPHQRRELVSPGNGIEPRSGILPDGLQRFPAQAVQRPDEQEGEPASDHRDAEQEDEDPIGSSWSCSSPADP